MVKGRSRDVHAKYKGKDARNASSIMRFGPFRCECTIFLVAFWQSIRFSQVECSATGKSSTWCYCPIDCDQFAIFAQRAGRGDPPVHRQRFFGGLIPSEKTTPLPSTPRKVLSQGAILYYALQRRGKRFSVGGIDQRAASPATSGSDETEEVITGVPHAIASNIGNPNPS